MFSESSRGCACGFVYGKTHYTVYNTKFPIQLQSSEEGVQVWPSTYSPRKLGLLTLGCFPLKKSPISLNILILAVHLQIIFTAETLDDLKVEYMATIEGHIILKDVICITAE